MRYLLLGNYGVGNLGDEALKDYFLTSFQDVEWTVVSATPTQGELPRFPGGLRSYKGKEWKKTRAALSQNDGVVFGGGTLFTDIESIKACVLWWLQTKFIRAQKKPYHLAFQGVGPFRTRLGEWLAKDVFRYAASVSVRDDASYLRVQNWGVQAEVIHTFDPVFSLVEKKDNSEHPKKVLTVIPRNNSNQPFRDRAIELLEKSDEWEEVHVLSLKPDDEREKKFCEELRGQAGVPSYVFQLRALAELVEAVAKGSYVLSQRYHGALVALALEIPLEVSPQSTHDKLSSIQAITASGELQSEVLQSLHEKVRIGQDALRLALKKDTEPSEM